PPPNRTDWRKPESQIARKPTTNTPFLANSTTSAPPFRYTVQRLSRSSRTTRESLDYVGITVMPAKRTACCSSDILAPTFTSQPGGRQVDSVLGRIRAHVLRFSVKSQPELVKWTTPHLVIKFFTYRIPPHDILLRALV